MSRSKPATFGYLLIEGYPDVVADIHGLLAPTLKLGALPEVHDRVRYMVRRQAPLFFLSTRIDARIRASREPVEGMDFTPYQWLWLELAELLPDDYVDYLREGFKKRNQAASQAYRDSKKGDRS